MTVRDLTFCLSAILWSTLVEASEVRITPHFSGGEKVDNEYFFQPGQSITLTCESNLANAVLNWTRVLGGLEPPSLVVLGVSGSSLIRNPIRPNDGGNYVCSDGQATASYYLNVLHDESLVPRKVTTNGTYPLVHLRCDQRFARRFPLIWSRRINGASVVLNNRPQEDRSFTVHGEDYALEIRSHFKRFPLKTGEYVCELNTTGTSLRLREPIRKTVVYEATPDVRIDGSTGSRNAVNGDSFRLTCVYSGSSSQDKVKWVINATSLGSASLPNVGLKTLVDYNDILNACPVQGHPDRRCLLNNARFSLDRDQHIENTSTQYERTSVLEINDVQDSDRGQYFCFVENEHGANNGTIFVRVKDRWAALWPFLGIVGEILLLAIIICACERRRSKITEVEEEAKPLKTSNDDQPEHRAAAENVRNRK